MAQTPSANPAPLSNESFLADRVQFWDGFCNFATFAGGIVVVLLAAMAFFLV
jgi:hypothetical protein